MSCNCIKEDVCPYFQQLAASGQNIMRVDNGPAWKGFWEVVRAYCQFRVPAKNANGEVITDRSNVGSKCGSDAT